VGFISDLPTQLVAAFRATLEEVLEADLILHVRDIAIPTPRRRPPMWSASSDELGVDEKDVPRIDRGLEQDRLTGRQHDSGRQGRNAW
jgi:GTP-binding protein HflX